MNDEPLFKMPAFQSEDEVLNENAYDDQQNHE